ncbi:TPA: hypothetical protein KKX05_002744 [Legionella pneumophila]|nr:hypothetical protein [Legionella pneumophila]HAT7956391.1 hypothetical protein [Legionella pneumophila]HAU1384769.1 hypothetical protein [Legionella pneumophila]HAU2065922.1 hypothetical protein [Legionella pneumophila]HBD7206057.1 hypothetical protein [Legionella pneumophila]
MRSEKPLIVKALGWVLYIGGNLIKAAFEITAPKCTDSLIGLRDRYENGHIGSAEYLERRSKIMGD